LRKANIDFEKYHKEVFQLQNKVQDQLYFPNNILPPPILQTPNQVMDFNPYDEFSLTPNEREGLLSARKLVYGKDVLADVKLDGELKSFKPKLGPKDILKLKNKYPAHTPLLDPWVCWERRHEHVPRGNASSELERALETYAERGETESHYFLYGRWFGSGKTALIYWLIKVAKSLNLPFIYRSEFWKDEEGSYKENDGGINDADAVAAWVKENIPVEAERCIIFLDEVDFDYQEEFNNYMIITAAKEIPEYAKDQSNKFKTLDLMVDYPFTAEETVHLITSLMNEETRDIFPQKLIRFIAEEHHKWRFPHDIKNPAVAVRVATYALGSALTRAREKETEEKIKVSQEDIHYWLQIADSPYLEHYPEVHDVHAEYLVFDGEDYVSVDPFNPGPVP